jgi:hypothetical protein
LSRKTTTTKEVINDITERIETLKTELENTPRGDDFCNVDLNCRSHRTNGSNRTNKDHSIN